MKTFKYILTITILLLVVINIKAQDIMWLSGMHNNNSLEYYVNGNLRNIPLVWGDINGEIPSNNQNIIVHGEFKLDAHNKWYFEVDKQEFKMALLSGTFTKNNYNCPQQNAKEGTLTKSDGRKVDIIGPQQLQDGQPITVTDAAWGIKECLIDNINKTYSIYYIKSYNDASIQRTIMPTPPPSGNNHNSDKTIYGSNVSKLTDAEIMKYRDYGLNKVFMLESFDPTKPNSTSRRLVSFEKTNFDGGGAMTGITLKGYYEKVSVRVKSMDPPIDIFFVTDYEIEHGSR